MRRRGEAAWVGASFLLIGLIALLDYQTGVELRLAILYLAPVALASWMGGRLAGALACVTSSTLWALDFWFLQEPVNPLIELVRLGFYLFVAELVVRLRQALERSDERFRTVLEGMQAMVCVCDARSGELLYANSSFTGTFGASRSFWPQSGELHDENTKRWYAIREHPFRWVDGREALLRVVSDISAERRARDDAARRRDATHRTARLVALGEFAAALAHELSQPLAAIASYNSACLRLLQSGAPEPSQLREAMRRSQHEAERAGAILYRLREMLRHPLPGNADVDLNEVARSVLQLAEPEAAEARVSLADALAESLPKVRGDQVLIEQVGLNLVRNAIEAVSELPPERRRVSIVTSAAEGGAVAFSVSDSGEGVSESVRGELFEPFVSSKPAGLGLGLSICRSVVEAHGGSIRHEPNGARGARFTFTLQPAGRDLGGGGVMHDERLRGGR